MHKYLISCSVYSSWKEVKVLALSQVRLFTIPRTVAFQAPLSMEFSGQEYWSGLPLPSPRDLPDPGNKPRSPALQQILYYLSHQGSPYTLLYCSVAQLCPTLCDPVDTRLPCPSPSPRACSNSCPLSQWCHPSIPSSVIPFSSCLQSFPGSGLFLVSQLFDSGGQSIGASASSSVLPMNIQDWLPLGLTGLIPLQSKGLSGVLSNTAVQKHQFFGTQSSLWSNSHIHMWLLEKL